MVSSFLFSDFKSGKGLKRSRSIDKAPVGLAILAMVGPSFVWCSEYIGSGEVILATRTGAILGTSILWAVACGVILKCWIGLCGARYTVCTGEGMVDMFSRIPGPKKWAVWLVLVAQFASATVSIGSLASAAGAFVNTLIPISPYFGGWFVTLFAVAVVWSGQFNILKIIMSIFVAIIILGVMVVAVKVFPGVSALLQSFSFRVPPVQDWAIRTGAAGANPWREVLPLVGWSAGGFASQVWYTYWVIGAGYGMSKDRGYGRSADTAELISMSRGTAERVKGWCRVVYTDAAIATIIGVVVTSCFLISGAGVLGTAHLAPQGPKVATTLSTIFSSNWGALGGFLFLLAGTSALIGTQIGQLAGWPRLLSDACRIVFPFFGRLEWKRQFRIFLLFFVCTNMIIVFTLGYEPVVLVKIGAVLDGLLLTPLQALWVAIGLYWILPRLLSTEAWQVLFPHWIFGFGLVIAFLLFGYFCLAQIPFVLK